MTERDPTKQEWHDRAQRALEMYPADFGFMPPWWQPIQRRRWKRRVNDQIGNYIKVALEGTKYDQSGESADG